MLDKRTANVFAYATCIDKWLMFVGSLAAIIHGTAMPMLAVVFGRMTGNFLMAQNISNAADSGTVKEYSDNLSSANFSGQIRYFCQFYIFLGIATFILAYVQIACWEAACERRVHKIRQEYFKFILCQEISWFNTHQSGDMIPRLAVDLDHIRKGNGDKFSLFIQSTSTFVFGYIVAFAHSWKLTLVMISLAPLLIITRALMAKKTNHLTRMEHEKHAIAGGIAKEALSCIRTVLSLNGYKRETDRFEAALENGQIDSLWKSVLVAIGTFSMSVIIFSSFGLAFWYGADLILQDVSFPRWTIFTILLAIGSGTTALGNAIPHLQAIVGAICGLRGILDTIENISNIGHSESGLNPGILTGKIEFKNVHFAHPIRKNINVLKDVSFTINPGEKVAFVEVNGSSKSTTSCIIDLLLRHCVPDKGKILIDGRELNDFNLKFLRNSVGVVSQETILFDGTLEDNLRIANPEASGTQIIEAMKLANASEFIKLFPKLGDTEVLEQVTELSDGQKQRFAIARVLIRYPKILLLEEVTSELDNQSACLVEQALKQAQEGLTTIAIAHRLSTVQDFDTIFVMSYGNIVEEGSYQDLLEQRNLFYRMAVTEQLDLACYEETIKDALHENKKSITSNGTFESEDMNCIGEREKEEKAGKIHKAIQAISFGKLCSVARGQWYLLLAAGFFGSCIIGGVLPLFAMLYSQIFQVYSKESKKLKEDAEFLSPLFVALGVLQGVGSIIVIMMFGRAGENITKEMLLKSFTNVLHQSAAYFDAEEHNAGHICARFATDAPNIRCLFTQLSWLLSSCINIVTGIVIAFLFGWKLALIVVLFVPLLAIAGYFQFHMQCRNQVRDSAHLDQADEISAEVVKNIRTVKALTCEDLFFHRYIESLEEPFRENMRMVHAYGAVYGLSQCIIYFMYATAFYFGAKFVGTGEIYPINVYRIFFQILFCSYGIGRLYLFIHAIGKARISATLMFNMIEEETSINSCSNAGIGLDLKGQLQLKDVHFAYPTHPTVQVLRGFDLTIEPGQKVALVGPSACGKSTVISLLQKFYDITKGKITFDGHKLETLNLEYLRHQICWISKEPVLFDCSIRENIVYGLEEVDHEDIVQAAKIVNIHEFVLTLPMGYSTNVGEEGVQLSGGQKQQIAIARALVRNPKILLLDEVSDVDRENEQLVVQEALDKAGEGRTCIVIAHRLSTIRNADNIVIIGNGKVVQQGTHQELFGNNGLYTMLCQKESFTENGID